MRHRWPLAAGAGVLLVALIALGLIATRDRSAPPPPRDTPAPTPAPAPPSATAHITATLFYGSQDGQALVPVRTEVPLADGVVAQGSAVLAAQFAAAPEPYVSVIPKGTGLRAFYVTERGEAFVDLSREISAAHPGGSLTELLTVQAIVHAVTANLPGVQRVQLLVEGQEVDTIAGHVDVRRPLARDPSLVRDDSTR